MRQRRRSVATPNTPEERRAAERVGHTPEAQVRWLIEVGSRYRYTGGLSPNDMRALRLQMGVFCGEPFRDEDVSRWLPRIHNGVKNLTEGRAWGHRLLTHYTLWVPRPDQQGGHLPSHWDNMWRDELVEPRGHIDPTQPNRLHLKRTLKDLMAHRICEVIAAVGDRLRRCQRQGCGRLFVRQKRQLHCTPACGWVTRTRRHRQGRRRRGGTDEMP
jgi:hypothetical protein